MAIEVHDGTSTVVLDPPRVVASSTTIQGDTAMDHFPGSIIVPPTYPDPTFQNVNTVPFGYAYGEGNIELDHTPPSQPTNLASSAVTTTSVTLNWSASTDDETVDHYNIYENGALVTTRVGTQAVLTGLTTKTQYSFAVAAVDENNNEGTHSSAVSVTTS